MADIYYEDKDHQFCTVSEQYEECLILKNEKWGSFFVRHCDFQGMAPSEIKKLKAGDVIPVFRVYGKNGITYQTGFELRHEEKWSNFVLQGEQDAIVTDVVKLPRLMPQQGFGAPSTIDPDAEDIRIWAHSPVWGKFYCRMIGHFCVQRGDIVTFVRQNYIIRPYDGANYKPIINKTVKEIEAQGDDKILKDFDAKERGLISKLANEIYDKKHE